MSTTLPPPGIDEEIADLSEAVDAALAASASAEAFQRIAVDAIATLAFVVRRAVIPDALREVLHDQIRDLSAEVLKQRWA